MKCPNCRQGIFFTEKGSVVLSTSQEAGMEKDQPGFEISCGVCPACERPIVILRQGILGFDFDFGAHYLKSFFAERIIFPNPYPRKVEAQEIPAAVREEFNEAAAVLAISPRASAALSRGLLWRVLQDHYSVSGDNLEESIARFTARPGVPVWLVEDLTAVSRIGCFDDHPRKGSHPGELSPVEPGEAQWLLDVLEVLLDFAFIQPKRAEERREQLKRHQAEPRG